MQNISYTEPANLGEMLFNVIGDDELCDYLTGGDGYRLGIYWDSDTGEVSVHVGPGVGDGDEIEPSERPFATVECPGIGNIDASFWTVDFCEQDEETGLYVVTGKFMEDKGRVVGHLEDVIRECCQEGNVSDEVAELRRKIIADCAENWGRRFESFPGDGDVEVWSDGRGGLTPQLFDLGRRDEDGGWESCGQYRSHADAIRTARHEGDGEYGIGREQDDYYDRLILIRGNRGLESSTGESGTYVEIPAREWWGVVE